MKKTQRPQRLLKRALVTHNSTPHPHETHTLPNVKPTTIDPIEILERIANWPANSNSDPDIMGDALDHIQQLASTAVHTLKAQARKSRP